LTLLSSGVASAAAFGFSFFQFPACDYRQVRNHLSRFFTSLDDHSPTTGPALSPLDTTKLTEELLSARNLLIATQRREWPHYAAHVQQDAIDPLDIVLQFAGSRTVTASSTLVLHLLYPLRYPLPIQSGDAGYYNAGRQLQRLTGKRWPKST